MGTLNAIYVRATELRKITAFQAEYPTAYTEPESEFYAVEQNGFVPPETDLRRLSAQLGTDVIWLGFQSASDSFPPAACAAAKTRRRKAFQ